MKPRSNTAADKDIGTKIRMRRIQLSMSQSNLADAVGVTFQQIQKYENGGNRVSGSRLVAIAKHLGVPASHFLPDDAGAAGLLPTLDSDVLKIAVRVQGMTAIQRRSISTIVDAISSAA